MRFEQLQVGQRVAHVDLGDGTVTEVTEAHVTVRFDRLHQVRRDPVLGVYDRRWFELHPNYLFFRSSQS